MVAAAEKRIRASASISPKPKPTVVVANEEAVKPSVSREEVKKPSILREEAEKPSVSRGEVDGPVEKREVEIGEELSLEHVEQLFIMVFGSGVSREILTQWSNQGKKEGKETLTTDRTSKRCLCRSSREEIHNLTLHNAVNRWILATLIYEWRPQ